MTDKLKYISNKEGKILSVIVPIDIWNELSSEIETHYLLDNPVMRNRLLDARNDKVRIPKDEVYEKLGI
jgi:hypothetical protein